MKLNREGRRRLACRPRQSRARGADVLLLLGAGPAADPADRLAAKPQHYRSAGRAEGAGGAHRRWRPEPAGALRGADEITDVQHSLEQMQSSLRGTLQAIQTSATQLAAAAAEEMHAITEQTSQGIHRQNGEIQMAATAVNEMSAAVEEVARNANHTSDASREAEQSARPAPPGQRDPRHHRAADRQAGRFLTGDQPPGPGGASHRPGAGSDPHHRRTDQPVGPQCRHRGGAPAIRAVVLPWSPTRCAPWRSAPRARPRKSSA